MRTKIKILIKAMRILANDIRTDDGVANAAIREAADRLEEQQVAVDACLAFYRNQEKASFANEPFHVCSVIKAGIDEHLRLIDPGSTDKF